MRLEPLDVWYHPKMGFVFVFIFSDFPAPSAAKWAPPTYESPSKKWNSGTRKMNKLS
jgi:hypothetical protein